MTAPTRLPSANIDRDLAFTADRQQFPNEPFEGNIAPVASGASGRRFFRIERGSQSRILMAYPQEPRENQLFAGIARVLEEYNIPVPSILADRPADGLLWLEDLGGTELYSLRNDKSARESAYRQAIDALHSLQRLPRDAFFLKGIETLPPFDDSLYQFEHQYFLQELVNRILPNYPRLPALLGELDQLKARLLEVDSQWIHRDFQSKNLMLDPAGRIRIVDFQGIRHGHPYYDLASLLCDPYVNLPAQERTELFHYFCDLQNTIPGQEVSSYSSAACQRLMQALGAYGRFGLGGGVEFFSDKIATALVLLNSHTETAGLPEIARLSQALIDTFSPPNRNG